MTSFSQILVYFATNKSPIVRLWSVKSVLRVYAEAEVPYLN